MKQSPVTAIENRSRSCFSAYRQWVRTTTLLHIARLAMTGFAALTITGALAWGQSSGQSSISVNFGASSWTANSTTQTVDYYSLTTGTNYGVVPVLGQYWNTQSGSNTGGVSGSIASLTDSSGSATGASLTWSSSCFWRVSTSDPTTSDARLFQSYLDDSNAAISVGNIPYEIYDLVFINSTDTSNNQFSAVSVNSQLYTYLNGQTTPGRSSWGSTASAVSASAALSEGNNYLVVSGLSGDLSIAHSGYYSARGTISAIQIVNALQDDYDWRPVTVSADGTAQLDQSSYAGLKLVRDVSSGTTIAPSQSATVDILKIQDQTGAGAVTVGGTFHFAGDHKWFYADSVSDSTVLTIGSAITAADDSFTLFANGPASGAATGRTVFNGTYGGALRLGGGLVDAASTGLAGASAIVLDGGGLYFATSSSFDLDLKVAGGGAFRVDGSTTTFSGALTDQIAGSGGSIRKVGAGTLNMTGTLAAFSGQLSMEAGTLQLSAGALSNSSASLFQDSGSLNISGTTSDYAGNIFKWGGTTTVSGLLENYSGTMTVRNGGASFASGAAITGLSGSINNWAYWAQTVQIDCPLELAATGLVSTWGRLDGSTIRYGTTNLIGAITGTGVITTEMYGITNVSGNIADFAGTISNTQANARTVITSADLSDFAGTLLVSGGAMILGDNSTAVPDLTRLSATVSGSGTLRLQYSGDYTVEFPKLSGTGTLILGSESAPAQAQSITVDYTRLGAVSTIAAHNATVLLKGTEIRSDLVAQSGGMFQLLAGNLITGIGDQTISATVRPATGSDLVFQPNGYTITLANGATQSGIGNITVAGPGTLALSGAKELSGSVAVQSGRLLLTGSGTGNALPDGTTVLLGQSSGVGITYGTSAQLANSAANAQIVTTVSQLGPSATIQNISGSLTISDLSRVSGGTTVLLNNTATASNLSVHAGTGYSKVGEVAASQIVPGVFVRTGTATNAGRVATLDSNGYFVAYADTDTEAVYTITDNSWTIDNLQNKNVINSIAKQGTINANVTLSSLTTGYDLLISSSSTVTLSGGTLVLQRGNHWIQGVSASNAGKLTSSYSSDGGNTVDLYVFTQGHEWNASKSNVANMKNGQIAVHSVKISDNGSQKLNLILDGPGGNGNTFQLMNGSGAYTGYTQIRNGRLALNSGTCASSEFQILNGGELAVLANPTHEKYYVSQGGTLSLYANSASSQIYGVDGFGGTVNFEHDNNNADSLPAARSYSPTFVDGANTVFQAIHIDSQGDANGLTTVNFRGNQTLKVGSFSTAGIANFANFTLNVGTFAQSAGTTTFGANVAVAADRYQISGGTVKFNSPMSTVVDGDLTIDSGIIEVNVTNAMASYLSENPLYDASGNASIVNTTFRLDFSANPELVVDSSYSLAVGDEGLTIENTFAELVNWSGWDDQRVLLSVADVGGSSTLIVRVTDGAHVPEPSSWALLILGIAGVWLVRKRK